MFAALRAAIPEILDYAGGETLVGLEGDDKFDTAHYVTYKTREDIDIYFHHPAHQEFFGSNRDHW